MKLTLAIVNRNIHHLKIVESVYLNFVNNEGPPNLVKSYGFGRGLLPVRDGDEKPEGAEGSWNGTGKGHGSPGVMVTGFVIGSGLASGEGNWSGFLSLRLRRRRARPEVAKAADGYV